MHNLYTCNMGLDDLNMNIASTVRQCSLYLHWGPGHPLAERGPTLESIYRVSLTVDLCKGNKIISLKNLFHHSQLGALKKKKHPGSWAPAQCAHRLRRPCSKELK